MMRYKSDFLEEQAVLQTAARMCAAARTAPKGLGRDSIVTLVLTGEDKDALAERMLIVADREYGSKESFFRRDAENLRKALAVVLIGVKKTYLGLPYCSTCGFVDCTACQQAGARCAFNLIDLGIALSSAAAMASADRIDNRIMFSIGKVAEEMEYLEEKFIRWLALPLSVTGKSPFFDRIAQAQAQAKKR